MNLAIQNHPFLINLHLFAGTGNAPNLTKISVSRKELFTVLKGVNFYKQSSSQCNEHLVSYIKDKSNIDKLSKISEKRLKEVVKVFVSKLLTKWKQSHQVEERFMKNNTFWIEGEVNFSYLQHTVCTPKTSSQGRPKKLFGEKCKRSQQRDIRPIVLELCSEKLGYAIQSSLIKSGKRTAAKVVDLAISSTPKRLKKMKQVHDSSLTFTMELYTPEEALGIMVDLGLTKDDYITLQRGAKRKGANIYPSYPSIAEVKKKCYPPGMFITESEATIPLQNLLDLTISRLAQIQSEVLLQNVPDEVININVFYKWGLDGSGGHSIYKQNFANHPEYGDANIILCTIAPLEVSIQSRDRKQIFWKNPSPSSTRYCRVISFKLKRETKENMKEEYLEIENQANNLRHTNILIGNKELAFKHILVCTMMDGKTCNVLTNTASSQACNVCKATPKDFNNIEKMVSRACDTTTFKFGISVLHAYLRCYEYLLHISYKMDNKEWQARSQEAKESVKNRKKAIASQFYTEMGLVVDQPKQGGGNSNDGNTARKFFDNPNLVSEITGINKDLISRFANILSTISSGHYINENKFKMYCLETAQMCIQLYGWYKMSATVHKLLLHGSDIIQSFPLPIGQLSEDVLEASHKSYKNLRLFHARKTSRINTNTDIINWLLVSSDPVITSCRKDVQKKRKPFSAEVIEMLKEPEFLGQVSMEQADDSDSDIQEEENT